MVFQLIKFLIIGYGAVSLHRNDIEKLKRLTNQLIELNHKALNRYKASAKNEDYTPDFYKEIKPFSDQIYETATQWKTLALEWLQQSRNRFLYPHQIDNTYENLLAVSVQAFQKKSRSTRFHSMIKSNDYVLQSLKKYLSASQKNNW